MHHNSTGVLGLVTLKNLLEEGFDATAFEKNEYVGGLWRFTEDENVTSVTRGRVIMQVTRY
jgi:dimethylaniline monooxygenase (N-oxide forming)